jgi:hypothetical protein
MAIPHKRGDTFTLSATASVPIVGWSLDSQVRQHGKLVDTLVIAVTDAATGAYTLTSSGSTAAWPLGELEFDVRYTTDLGQIISTEVVSINCKAGPTV